MNLFYEVLANFGIAKISICIIVFTIIVKMLMLPMNIKQQRSMKLNSVITPEVQAIQKKYANKKDNESLTRQQQEIGAVYQKYGTSPTGGCLPMLIQMPIIFALYAVMACLPNYINDIDTMYNDGVVSYVIGVDEDNELDYHTINELRDIDTLSDSLLEDKKSKDDELDSFIDAYYGEKKDKSKSEIRQTVYDSFTSAYSHTFDKKSAWDVVEKSFRIAITDIEKFQELSAEEWASVTDENLVKYAEYTEEDWNNLKSDYELILDKMEENREEIKEAYSFFTIDLSVSPANGVKIAILIPILSALAQLLNMKVSMSNQESTGNGTADSMMSSMKVMSYSMCLVSAIFCYSFPAGLGLYWVVSSLVQVVIQIIMNKHFKKLDVDTIIKQNMEKVNKKREKAGLAPNAITTAASINAKSYQARTQAEENNVPVKKGSLAEKANLAKKYADKK
ncbi:MAG: YidC/Oxa1 family membrane protein insertase [Lachnospiraceae bacterium]|nr:YidC/Oxa1 family membrane protein insertase [Lachnospiraceae bacterium]